LLQQLDFAIDAQDLGHLLIEQGIAAFQIIAHLVRLDLVRGENLAQRALSKFGEAFVSCRRTMFANVSRQQPRRAQFVRIAEILGFAAGKIDNESSRLFGDDTLASRARTVVESSHDAGPFRPLQASFVRLMCNADGSTYRVKRRCFAIGKQHPRACDPARRFRPRTRKPRQLRQILFRKRQLDHSTWSRHDQIRLVQQITEQEYKRRSAPTESPAYERIQGICLLVGGTAYIAYWPSWPMA
jgi:hypothetical protein